MADPRDFHVPQPSYTREDLLKSSEGAYFGPGNAQLPAPPMLMMDRIIEISLDGGEFGKGHVVAELDITPEPLVFRLSLSRRPRDAGMPGSGRHVADHRLLARLVGLAGQGPRRRCRRGQVQRRHQAGHRLRALRGHMRQVRRGKLAVGIANGRVFADDACVYLARDMKVGLIASAV